MLPCEADSYEMGTTTKLTGYTSTSKDFDKAFQFAVAKCHENQIPVVFKISFHGNSGLFELDDGITAYPGEQEVLLQDGLEYRITANEDGETAAANVGFRLIKLSYPA